VVEARTRKLLLFIIVLLVPASARSQTIALQDTVYRLSEVLIEADRLSELDEIRNRPAFITLLPMEEAGRRVTSTAEHLSQSVSFHVKSTGGYGSYSTASIRGSSSRQVSVFLDGVPLNPAQSGAVDFADLPVSSLSRVEVYRGFSAFDLSGASIGGVVNLVTQDPSDHGRGRLSASYGSLSTQKYMGSYAISRSGWDVLAVGTALSTKGNFDFLDDNGTPYNKSDDEIVQRINNRLEQREGFVKISHPLGAGTLVVADQILYRKQGLPGYSSYQSTTEALSKTHNLLHIAWKDPVAPSLPLRFSGGVFAVYQRDHFQDRREKTPPAKPDVKNRSISYGANVRWKLPLPEHRLSLRGLVEARKESFRPEEIFTESVEGPEQSRTSLIVTLENEIDLWPGRLRLIPGGRFEKYTDQTGEMSSGTFLFPYLRSLQDTSLTHQHALGSLSAVATLGAGVRLKGNYGRYHRVPSLMELFGYQGMVLPNPTLKPETGLNHDLGISWDHRFAGGGYVSVEGAYFWSKVEDLIVWYRWGQGARALNIDRARVEGYEIQVTCGEWKGLSFSGNLTGMDAVNTGPVSYAQDKQLPDRPEVAAFGKLVWRRGRASVFYEFDYIGGNYWNSYNGIPPNNEDAARIRRLHGAGVTVPLGPAFEVTAEIKNITDERVEDVMGYPMPGRSVYGTVVYSL
jgi:iron complex outermembrane receptor protein